MDSILDQRGSEGDRRPLAPTGNGKADWIRYIVSLLFAAAVAFGVAFWTASVTAEQNREVTAAQIRTGLAIIEERQRNQNDEVMRAIQQLREDLRDVGRVRR